MRLSDSNTPNLDAGGENRDAAWRQGPGLWGPYYFTLWVCASLLATLIFYSRTGNPGLITAGLWTASLGLLCLLACASRILIHDLLVDLSQKERFYLGLLIAIIPFLPSMVRRTVDIPLGILWTVPFLLTLSVKPKLARRLLAWMLMGAWFAALRVSEKGELALLLAFAVSWLLALGATHFAYTGDPHDLSGWWPVRRVLLNTIYTTIPAGVTGALTWWAWPQDKRANPFLRPTGLVLAKQRPERLIKRLSEVDMLGVIWDGAVALGMTALLFMILLYLRRWLTKRRRGAPGLDLLPGQVARLEYQKTRAKPKKPALPGLRGQIVTLWGRWAAALAHGGSGRHSGETAADYAARLAREEMALNPPAVITNLLEQAHYGATEPTGRDVETMRRYVQEELSRISLQRQTPVEAVDDEM